MSGWVSVNDWDRFQHVDVTRGSGPPPWIKSYTRLTDQDEYLELTAAERGILHGLWLLYAKSRCEVRGTTASLSRRLGVRVLNAQLDRLVDAGFITIVASKSQAEGWQPASGLARARGEEEEEEEVKPAGQGRSKGTGDEGGEATTSPSSGALPGRLGDSDIEDKVIDGQDWSLGPVDVEVEVEQLVQEWGERA